MKQSKWLLLSLLLMLSLILVSCGASPAPAPAPAPGPSEEEPAEPVASAEEVVFDTGTVSCLVIEPWVLFGANESMVGYAVETDINTIYLVKDAKTESDVFSKPGIQINYYNKTTTMGEASREYYDDVEELEPLALANYTWEGFKGESFGAPVAILFANSGQGDQDQFQVAVWMDMGSGGEASLDDPDVLAIIGSIQPTQ